MAENSFLAGLGNITNNEQAEIAAIKKEFAEHMNKQVDRWVNETVQKIKKLIEESVQKREYTTENGKKVVTGEIKVDDLYCGLKVMKERYDGEWTAYSDLLRKIQKKALSFPEYDEVINRSYIYEMQRNWGEPYYGDYKYNEFYLVVTEIQKSFFKKARYVCKVKGKYIKEYGRRLPQKLSQEGIHFKGFEVDYAVLSCLEDSFLIPFKSGKFYDNKGRPRIKKEGYETRFSLYIKYQVCF